MKSYSLRDNGSSIFGNFHRRGAANGFLPNSLKFISSCIKTASSGVRSASGDSHERKDQVLWASFDRIELGLSSFKHVLLLGYSNGFQVLDVDDASNVSELVSKRDDSVTFLQMQPLPAKSQGCEGFRTSHPLLLVVASDEPKSPIVMQNGWEAMRDGHTEASNGNLASSTSVRFYSLSSHSYIHVLRFRSTVHTVRCSSRIVAIGLATQIYCFDALTLENKFSVLTYPIPQLGGQGSFGVNMGYGPMDVGPRWLAYAPNNPMFSNTSLLSPKRLTPSPGVSPSTSPSNGSLMARCAVESSKQLAAGLMNLSDMGYKTLSKYCQEFIPDGYGSPVSSKSSWKPNRGTTQSTEADTAGVVVVKDFVSRVVISQFRAHTSPISVLCFDPSGTLLVTASVHGHNINVFRIMPSSSKTGSGSQCYDWCSSHVHLYRLHRGVTSAVIQDICFSNYSQWISIITAKGTSHIFLLSPYGGETSLQLRNSHMGRPTLLPTLSLPWWSTPYFLVNKQTSTSHLMPPPPVTTYVVTRIKNCSSGWLNSVSSAASSATGKITVPSGAVATVFHSSGLQNTQPSLAKVHALEHLLVFTTSGHLMQYDLLPSVGEESSESVPRTIMASPAQIQEEHKLKVEPLHWWDVCRRTNWPEREECISGLTFDSKEGADIFATTLSHEGSNNGDKDSEKCCDRSHFYIANAEVQMSFGRIPIWQKSKIYFYTMCLLDAEELALIDDNAAGELEIEKFPVHEVEVRQKEPLPVFDHFQKSRSDWSERALSEGTCSPSFTSMAKGKLSDGIISYPKLDCYSETSDGSLENYYPPMRWSQNGDIDQKQGPTTSPPSTKAYINKDCSLDSPKQFSIGSSGASEHSSNPLPADTRIPGELEPSNGTCSSEGCSASSRGSDLLSNVIEEHVTGSLDFEQHFHEGYCGSSDLNRCTDTKEAIVDADGSRSPIDQNLFEEEADNDDMLGGVFAFSD